MLMSWLRMGAGHDRKSMLLQSWGFGSQNISPMSRRRGGLETEFNHVANDSVNHVYVMRLSGHQSSVEIPGWWRHRCADVPMCREGNVSWFHGERPQNSPYMSCENKQNEGGYIRKCTLKPMESALIPSGYSQVRTEFNPWPSSPWLGFLTEKPAYLYEHLHSV